MNIEHPANAKLLRYFERRAKQYNYTTATEPQGTHPDLVMRLWDELGGLLPDDCHAVVHGAPVLMHRKSGIIFAFAGGTHTYALRLPPELRNPAIAAGATRVYHYRPYRELHIAATTFDLAEIGDEWVFGGWLEVEQQWIRAAYDFAANT